MQHSLIKWKGAVILSATFIVSRSHFGHWGWQWLASRIDWQISRPLFDSSSHFCDFSQPRWPSVADIINDRISCFVKACNAILKGFSAKNKISISGWHTLPAQLGAAFWGDCYNLSKSQFKVGYKQYSRVLNVMKIWVELINSAVQRSPGPSLTAIKIKDLPWVLIYCGKPKSPNPYANPWYIIENVHCIAVIS